MSKTRTKTNRERHCFSSELSLPRLAWPSCVRRTESSLPQKGTRKFTDESAKSGKDARFRAPSPHHLEQKTRTCIAFWSLKNCKHCVGKLSGDESGLDGHRLGRFQDGRCGEGCHRTDASLGAIPARDLIYGNPHFSPRLCVPARALAATADARRLR